MWVLRLYALIPRRIVLISGSFFGLLQYYLYPKGRWFAHQNLKRAFPSWSSSKRRRVACKSFQNYASALFDFVWVCQHPHLFEKYVRFLGEKEIMDRLSKKKGVVFLAGHQAGWEFAFLAFTRHFAALLIAKPFKGRSLSFYEKWVIPLREKFMGCVIEPQNALAKCRQCLLQGGAVAIADHSYRRKSRYTYPLFGVPAFTSLAPAILAYQSHSPLVVCSFAYDRKGYTIQFFPPLFANQMQPVGKGTRELMDRAMSYLESSIKDHVETWAWMYNRWRLKKK